MIKKDLEPAGKTLEDPTPPVVEAIPVQRISSPTGESYESDANNTYSMSIETSIEGIELVPFETDSFSLSFSDSESYDRSLKVRDNGIDACQFQNPSADNPMEASKYLRFLNLDGISKRLRSFYVDLQHFHYPIDAMLRTIIYQRLIGLRHTTQLSSKLENSWKGHLPRNLGFREKADGSFKIPDRRTLDHFVWKRLGKEGTSFILDEFIIELRKRLARRRIALGRRIAVDSTPLEGMHNDPDAEYNGHYEIRMYKIHQATCINTGLSLAKIVSRANDYDGDYLIPLIQKLQRLGITVDEVLGDQHYGSLSNWARMNLEFGITPYFNLSQRDTMRYDGYPHKLGKQYNSMWKEPDFIPNADMDCMLKFLLSHSIVNPVGAYFRNKWLEIKQRDPKKWQEIYNDRTYAERFHAHVKENLGMERNLRVKGIESIEVYTNLFWIAEIACALTRVRNGIKGPLLRANQRELF